MLNSNKIILLGDNFYPNGILKENDQQWSNYRFIFNDIPNQHIYAIMGNHDYYGNPLYQLNENEYSNNEFYFKRTFHNIDMFFLDTVLLYKDHASVSESMITSIHGTSYNELKNNQLKWLQEELEKSKNNGRKKIVFGHYPVISNGLYTNSLQPLYNTLVPILEKYNVDAYVSGHEHNIQYIKKKISDSYILNQFIIGSSSEYRTNEFKRTFHENMYDNSKNYYLQIYETNNNLFFEFKTRYGIIKYCYVL